MKKTVTNTTLGLIALATMSFAASNAQANHDHPQRFEQHHDHGQYWQDRGDYAPQHNQRVNQQRIAEINTRQAKLLNRIERGTWDGSLTRRESRTLMSELRYFDSVKRDFISDGFLTPSEFRQLDNGLNIVARNIWTQRHDDDTHTSNYDDSRYGHRWGYNR